MGSHGGDILLQSGKNADVVVNITSGLKTLGEKFAVYGVNDAPHTINPSRDELVQQHESRVSPQEGFVGGTSDSSYTWHFTTQDSDIISPESFYFRFKVQCTDKVELLEINTDYRSSSEGKTTFYCDQFLGRPPANETHDPFVKTWGDVINSLAFNINGFHVAEYNTAAGNLKQMALAMFTADRDVKIKNNETSLRDLSKIWTNGPHIGDETVIPRTNQTYYVYVKVPFIPYMKNTFLEPNTGIGISCNMSLRSFDTFWGSVGRESNWTAVIGNSDCTNNVSFGHPNALSFHTKTTSVITGVEVVFKSNRFSNSFLEGYKAADLAKKNITGITFNTMQSHVKGFALTNNVTGPQTVTWSTAQQSLPDVICLSQTLAIDYFDGGMRGAENLKNNANDVILAGHGTNVFLGSRHTSIADANTAWNTIRAETLANPIWTRYIHTGAHLLLDRTRVGTYDINNRITNNAELPNNLLEQQLSKEMTQLIFQEGYSPQNLASALIHPDLSKEYSFKCVSRSLGLDFGGAIDPIDRLGTAMANLNMRQEAAVVFPCSIENFGELHGTNGATMEFEMRTLLPFKATFEPIDGLCSLPLRPPFLFGPTDQGIITQSNIPYYRVRPLDGNISMTGVYTQHNLVPSGASRGATGPAMLSKRMMVWSGAGKYTTSA